MNELSQEEKVISDIIHNLKKLINDSHLKVEKQSRIIEAKNQQITKLVKDNNQLLCQLDEKNENENEIEIYESQLKDYELRSKMLAAQNSKLYDTVVSLKKQNNTNQVGGCNVNVIYTYQG